MRAITLPALVVAPFALAVAHRLTAPLLGRLWPMLLVLVPVALFFVVHLVDRVAKKLDDPTRQQLAGLLTALSVLALVLVPVAQAQISLVAGWALLPASFWLLVVAGALVWRDASWVWLAVIGLAPVLGFLATPLGDGDLGSSFESDLQTFLLVPIWFPFAMLVAGRFETVRHHPRVATAVLLAGPLLAFATVLAATLWNYHWWTHWDELQPQFRSRVAWRTVGLVALLAGASVATVWLLRLSKRHRIWPAWLGALLAAVPVWLPLLFWLHPIPT